MTVDYNNYSKTFSNSRKNMKWAEIEYFLGKINSAQKNVNILDIGCGSGRLLGELINNQIIKNSDNYLGVDLSSGLLNEAKKKYSEYNFLEKNMLDLNILEKNKYDHIFFIASYHHLDNIDNRLKILKISNSLLKKGGIIYMTNWALNSKLNIEKYKNSIIPGSTNRFLSLDYSIKIGGFTRYYHCFTTEELSYLFESSGFEIIENREYDNMKNIISIIRKK